MEVVFASIPVLAQGALITIEITILSVAIGSVLGLIAGLSRLSSRRILRFMATAYVDFFRGTPLLVQIFIIYYGIPKLLMDLQTVLVDNYGMTPVAESFALPRFLAAVIACSINSGAYIAEIFRAGVQSIDKGQMEAARSLGMTQGQAMRYIILPQAFKRVIPPMGNEFIAMLKDTSLLSVIGFVELTRTGQLIIARNYESFAIWLTVGFFYLLMTFSLSRYIDYLERRLKTGD